MAANSRTDAKLAEVLDNMSTQIATLNEGITRLKSSAASEGHSEADFGKLTAAEIELVKNHRSQTAAAASDTQGTPDITQMSAAEIAKLPPETLTQLFRECGQVLAGQK